MKGFLLAVACDGVGCPEALSLTREDDWLDELAQAGWVIAADGADLCPDCNSREQRREAITRRTAARAPSRRGVLRLA